MKTKLVVYNNHTLGYILPEIPNTVQVLRCSVLRYPHTGIIDNFPIGKNDSIRLASEKDFNDFNVSFEGYKNDPEYVYEG